MAYLVTGATGTVGKEVVKALIKNHHIVRAGSRYPEQSRKQLTIR